MGAPGSSLISTADELRRFFSVRLGGVPGEAEGVLHVAAVWRPPGSDRNVVLRIVEESPKSGLDALLLAVGRARADAIVTTGLILREEPALTHDLQGSPSVAAALHSWRRDVLGLADPPWLLVLTSGKDLDPDHPAFHAWARPIVFCPQACAGDVRERLGGAPIEMVAMEEPSLGGAIDHLRRSRQARRITIEAGPSTASEAYREPLLVDELSLSVFEADSIPRELEGGELPSYDEIVRRLGPPLASLSALEASGRWRFEHYRCAIFGTEQRS